MPRYSAPFDPKTGPHIDVFLSKPLSTYSDEDSEASKYKVSMLIDSGASKTAISPVIAQEIGLIPSGKEALRSATNEIKSNIYHLDLTCELVTPYFYMPDLRVIEFEFAKGWRDGFLGRDFLEKVVFEISGPERKFSVIF